MDSAAVEKFKKYKTVVLFPLGPKYDPQYVSGHLQSQYRIQQMKLLSLCILGSFAPVLIHYLWSYNTYMLPTFVSSSSRTDVIIRHVTGTWKVQGYFLNKNLHEM